MTTPDFLQWFDEVVGSTPMHFELTYSKHTDWFIYIWRKGTGKDDANEEIFRCMDIDLSLLFAKAEIAVKEYLTDTNGGY